MLCFGTSKRSNGTVSKHDKKNPGRKRNEDIEKQIRLDRRRQSKEIKILLLGAGESGKSTVIKQMKLIHKDGFTFDERNYWKNIIFHNLVDAFLLIFDMLQDQGDHVQDSRSEEHLMLLNEAKDIVEKEPIPEEYANCFMDLWQDENMQLAILRGNEWALHDNLHYFMDSDNTRRMFNVGYLPTDQDILRTRLRTTGIAESDFKVGELSYRMFDVGGQRSERKKWIHAFENVDVVLFLAAISGYDQALPEDRYGNQMGEALHLFDQISNSKWFTKSAIILFLNKMDLFEEKFKSGLSPISRYFQDYQHTSKDIEIAKSFFADKFKKLVRDKSKIPYIHFTNATSTTLLKVTMKNVQDFITQKNLKDLIL